MQGRHDVGDLFRDGDQQLQTGASRPMGVKMTTCQMCIKWQKEPAMRIAEFEQCYVMLNSDQYFPGYCFVLTKAHVTELFHLEESVRNAVMDEVNSVARAIYGAFNPAKINYELLGNMVPHMHWHIVPRFTTDPLWPRPIWSEQHQTVSLSASDYAEQVALIQRNLRPS